MLTEDRYYEHSGRFGPAGVVATLLAGAVTALILGPLYGLISFINPFIYVNFLLACGLGLAVGWMAGGGARAGKVRHVGATAALAAVAGLVAVYGNWVAYILVLSEGELLAVSPARLLWAIGLVADNGAWHLSDWTPTGAVLWALWALEAAIIVGLAVYAARRRIAQGAFCERCQRWAEGETLAPYTLTADRPDLVEALEAGRYEALGAFARAPEGANPHAEFDLAACPACGDFRLLSIRHVAEVAGKKKKEKTRQVSDIVRNLMVDARAHEIVRGLPAAPPEPAGADEAGGPSEAGAAPAPEQAEAEKEPT